MVSLRSVSALVVPFAALALTACGGVQEPYVSAGTTGGTQTATVQEASTTGGSATTGSTVTDPPSESTSTGTTGGTTGDTTTGGSTTGGTTTGGTTTGGTTNTCTPVTWANFAKAWFGSNCDGCHGGYTSYTILHADLSNISSRISSGSMPPRVTLPSADKASILQWIKCGAPQ